MCLKGILYLNYQLNSVPCFASLKYRIRLIKVLNKNGHDFQLNGPQIRNYIVQKDLLTEWMDQRLINLLDKQFHYESSKLRVYMIIRNISSV